MLGHAMNVAIAGWLTIMSVFTPTVLRRPPVFPHLLAKPPQPYPTPLLNRRPGVYGRLNSRRDLQREMDDLSDEENEVEDIVSGANSLSTSRSW